MVVTTASHIRADLAEPFNQHKAKHKEAKLLTQTIEINQSNVIYFLYTVLHA
jgi:hypothetical protein